MSAKYARVGLPRQPPAEAKLWRFTKKKRAQLRRTQAWVAVLHSRRPLGRGTMMFFARRISPLLPRRVMPVDPNFLMMTPGPMSRNPHVVNAPDIITRAVGIIRSIANLYENPDSTRARRENAARTE